MAAYTLSDALQTLVSNYCFAGLILSVGRANVGKIFAFTKKKKRKKKPAIPK